jgi:predicted metal-dependent HD superfamily phosphohydrolase
LFDDLHRAYAAPDRHYHGVRHVDECLRALRAVAAHARRLAEVEAALYFHDAIYDTHRDDNEARSADWARAALSSGGAPADVGDRVHALILATRHAAPLDDPDARLTVDVDLGILGQSPAAFARYDSDIRREYHWVAWDDYAAARTTVLRRFLARERIYATRAFYERFEAQARYNIAIAIASLARGPTSTQLRSADV